MKLKHLIKKLTEIQKKLQIDPDVLVDVDENGHYQLEDAKMGLDEDGTIHINLISSNET
jgi:hypothetical protein